MVKYKCIKAECSVCGNVGLIQLFLNKNGEVRYARTRHYSHLDKDSKKPKFTYCRIEDLEELKTLLKSQGISLSIGQNEGSLGQDQTKINHDLELCNSSPIQQNKECLGSLARWGVTLVR